VAIDLLLEVLKHAPWGIIVASTELDGRCEYVNEEFIRITGYELDDLPTVADWIRKAYPDPSYRQVILDNWPADTSPTQMGRNVAYRVNCRDGSTKRVQFRASMLKPGQMAVMLMDVTERHRIAQEHREREERYRQLVETSPFGIVLHAGETVDYANATALRILGADAPEQLVGRRVIDFVYPDCIERSVERIAEVRQRGMLAGPEETRFVRLDGSVIDVEGHAALVPHRGRNAIQITFVDITERKRLESERRRLDKRMQQAQLTESLSLLAGGVAHDLNNLLVAVLGRADLGRRLVRDDPALTGHLEAVVEAAEGAAELVNQLLAYAGQRKLSTELVDLGALVSQSEGLLRSMVGNRAELRIDLPPNLPLLRGDEVQLRQVLLNLVGNAADAMGGREGCIGVRSQSVSADAPALRHAYAPEMPSPVPHLVLEVLDEGVGMDEATCQQVFDPFFTTKSAGRGLGLAAAHGIVRAHGGAVGIDSEPDVGTTFRIYLPAASDAVAGRPQERSSAQAWRGEGTVLVVDDEPLVRKVATSMLGELGFDVVEATTGEMALALVDEQPCPFTCVLMDLTMPGLSGAETLERMLATHADLPVVLSSGHDEAATMRHLASVRPRAFLSKPYTTAQLGEALRRALEG